MKNKKDRRYHVMALLLVITAMAAGYALFSETLNISGTAETTGTFDVEFSSAAVNTHVNAPGSSAVIAASKNTLTLNVPDLQKPGSSVLYDVVVRNNGNIGAELLSVNLTGNSDADIKLTYPTFPTGTVLAPGATYAFTIKVEWATISQAAPKTLNFTASLNYEQE